MLNVRLGGGPRLLILNGERRGRSIVVEIDVCRRGRVRLAWHAIGRTAVHDRLDVCTRGEPLGALALPLQRHYVIEGIVDISYFDPRLSVLRSGRGASTHVVMIVVVVAMCIIDRRNDYVLPAVV